MHIPVRFMLQGLPIAQVGILQDVSLTGVRMSTAARLKVGAEIALHIPAGPDGKPLVFRTAIVRSVINGTSHMMGMVFVELSTHQLERLSQFIAPNHAAARSLSR